MERGSTRYDGVEEVRVVKSKTLVEIIPEESLIEDP